MLKLTLYVEPFNPAADREQDRQDRAGQTADTISQILKILTPIAASYLSRPVYPDLGSTVASSRTTTTRPPPAYPDLDAIRLLPNPEETLIGPWVPFGLGDFVRYDQTGAVVARTTASGDCFVFGQQCGEALSPSAAKARADERLYSLNYFVPSEEPEEPDHPFSPDRSVAGEGPRPPTKGTNQLAASEATRQAKLVEGFEAFVAVLHIWLQAFGVEGAAQPDRAKALQDLFEDPRKAGAALRWVQEQGGLRKAVRVALARKHHSDATCDVVAENLAQVASALAFTDLSDLLEQATRMPTLTKQ